MGYKQFMECNQLYFLNQPYDLTLKYVFWNRLTLLLDCVHCKEWKKKRKKSSNILSRPFLLCLLYLHHWNKGYGGISTQLRSSKKILDAFCSFFTRSQHGAILFSNYTHNFVQISSRYEDCRSVHAGNIYTPKGRYVEIKNI